MPGTAIHTELRGPVHDPGPFVGLGDMAAVVRADPAVTGLRHDTAGQSACDLGHGLREYVRWLRDGHWY